MALQIRWDVCFYLNVFCWKEFVMMGDVYNHTGGGVVCPSGRGLFGCGTFFWCAMFFGMPQVSGDSEGIDSHAQGTRRQSVELFSI